MKAEDKNAKICCTYMYMYFKFIIPIKQYRWVRNTDAPAARKSKYGKNLSKSYILTPPQPQGHVMTVKCEESIDELTVQVWLLYHQPNFKYCTLFVSRTELRTNRQTKRRTDRQTIRLLDDPRRTFQAGGMKILLKWQFYMYTFFLIYTYVIFTLPPVMCTWMFQVTPWMWFVTVDQHHLRNI